jgi:hypothetical protein
MRTKIKIAQLQTCEILRGYWSNPGEKTAHWIRSALLCGAVETMKENLRGKA